MHIKHNVIIGMNAMMDVRRLMIEELPQSARIAQLHRQKHFKVLFMISIRQGLESLDWFRETRQMTFTHTHFKIIGDTGTWQTIDARCQSAMLQIQCVLSGRITSLTPICVERRDAELWPRKLWMDGISIRYGHSIQIYIYHIFTIPYHTIYLP